MPTHDFLDDGADVGQVVLVCGSGRALGAEDLIEFGLGLGLYAGEMGHCEDEGEYCGPGGIHSGCEQAEPGLMPFNQYNYPLEVTAAPPNRDPPTHERLWSNQPASMLPKSVSCTARTSLMIDGTEVPTACILTDRVRNGQQMFIHKVADKSKERTMARRVYSNGSLFIRVTNSRMRVPSFWNGRLSH